MSNLTVNHSKPQLRVPPLLASEPLRYERMVANRWVPCNHERVAGIVGVLIRRKRNVNNPATHTKNKTSTLIGGAYV